MAGCGAGRLASQLHFAVKTHSLCNNGVAALIQSYRNLHTTVNRPTVYRKEFVEPILDRDEMPTQKQHMGDRVFLPIKAMKTSDKFSHYHDPLVEKFINCCMSHGCRTTAKTIVSKAFERIKLTQVEKYHKAESEAEKRAIICDPVKVFHRAFDNARPVFKFRRYIKGGTIYLVPVAAQPSESRHMAMRWLRDSAQNKDKKVSIWNSMARELLEASQNTGRSVRKKQDLHRQCDQNKAYAHFIWSK